MRWQVQEMARAERMLTDDAIADQVTTYNELIPNDGELSGTLFIELTDDAKLREWLPKLVNVQHDVRFDLADGSHVDAIPEDEERLTSRRRHRDRPLPQVPVHARAAGDVADRACRASWSTIPTTTRSPISPTSSAPSLLATSRSRPCRFACCVSIRICRYRASSTPTTPGSTSTRAKT